MVHPYRGIPVNTEKEQTINIHINLDKSQGHYGKQQNIPFQKITYYMHSQHDKITEMENKLVVSKD